MHDPSAGLTIDQAGTLHGAAEYGSDYYGYGTVFKLTPQVGRLDIHADLQLPRKSYRRWCLSGQ